MRFLRYRPPAPLDACVECFWWSKRDRVDSATERMLPSGSAQLIIALHDTAIACNHPGSVARPLAWRGGIVHGPQWSYYDSGPKPSGAFVGVSFRPGAAGALLGVPVSEVTDHHITLDALWGRRGEELRERLLAAQGPKAIFRLLEQELTSRLRQRPQIHPALIPALGRHRDAWSQVRVAEVQRASGYSPRHFIALFRSAVGLTPKHFYRIKRFTTVLRHLADDDAGLAELAGVAGYSDQAHLTREFREFAGLTPTQYRPRNRESLLHQRLEQVTNLQDQGLVVPHTRFPIDVRRFK